MNTATNAPSPDQLRAEYRAIRAAAVLATGIARATFDAKAQQRAHELADGERVSPTNFVRAAKEIAFETAR